MKSILPVATSKKIADSSSVLIHSQAAATSLPDRLCVLSHMPGVYFCCWLPTRPVYAVVKPGGADGCALHPLMSQVVFLTA